MTDGTQELDEILENITQKIEKSCEEYFEQTVLDGEYTQSVDNAKDEAKQALLDWHQQEIAKEDKRGLEVLGAVLNAVGGEVTITKSDMMDLDKYVIMNYRNIDGSVTYAVTLKEHKEAEL